MAWIESHQSLQRHRKTIRAAALLKITRVQLIGHLQCLWWWALDNADPDGRLGDVLDVEVAEAAEWPTNDAARFVDALSDVGFLEGNEQGEMTLHDWFDYAGKLSGRRAQDAERKRAARRGRPADEVDERPGRPSYQIDERPSDVRRTESPASAPTQPTQPTQPDTTNTTEPEEPPPHTPPPSPSRSAGGGGGVRIPLVDLSTESREVLDAWRLAQGLRAPPRLNPTQAAALEDAVADLGSERLKAACSWAAGEGITQLTKAIRGARTKRERDERTSSDLRNGNGKRPPARGGAGSVRHI